MNIVMLYHQRDQMMCKRIEKIIEWVKITPLLQGHDIQVFSKEKKAETVDVLFIFSNDRSEILSFLKERRSTNRSVIFTDNLEPAFILGCLDITPFVCYIKSDKKTILIRLQEILYQCQYGRKYENLYYKE